MSVRGAEALVLAESDYEKGLGQPQLLKLFQTEHTKNVMQWFLGLVLEVEVRDLEVGTRLRKGLLQRA